MFSGDLCQDVHFWAECHSDAPLSVALSGDMMAICPLTGDISFDHWPHMESAIWKVTTFPIAMTKYLGRENSETIQVSDFCLSFHPLISALLSGF